MAVLRGMDAKLYRNTATHGSPTWALIAGVVGTTQSGQTDKIDATDRDNNGWKANLAGLRDGAVSFEMNWDPANADLVAIRDHWIAGTTFEIAEADGAIATVGTTYFNAQVSVTNFEWAKPIDGAQRISVELSPAPAAFAPAYVVVSS